MSDKAAGIQPLVEHWLGIRVFAAYGGLFKLPLPPAEGALLLRLALQPPAASRARDRRITGGNARRTPERINHSWQRCCQSCGCGTPLVPHAP